MSAATSPAPSATTPLVVARDLHLRYPGGLLALRGIDLELHPGEFVALVGPSGAGKSTLLRAIAGLLPTQGGHLHVAGLPPDEARTRWGRAAFVFQDPTLLPWRSVRANVALPLELGRSRNRDRKPGPSTSSRNPDTSDRNPNTSNRNPNTSDRNPNTSNHNPDTSDRNPDLAAVDRVLALVGLSEFADTHPAQLSGGMRMRASLARALVTRPELLLLDEPFGALDERTREHLDDELLTLWQRDRFAALAVTHNLAEAVHLADRVLVLSPRPGRIVHEQRIDLPRPRPADLHTTREFTAQLTALRARVQEAE